MNEHDHVTEARTSVVGAVLGVGHMVVAVALLPASLFLGIVSIPLVLPALVWLFVLGIQLVRARPGIRRRLRITHFVMAPFAVLLIAFGIYALEAGQRSASTGGGLLGTFGLIPLVEGLLAGCLSVACLVTTYCATALDPETPRKRPRQRS